MPDRCPDHRPDRCPDRVCADFLYVFKAAHRAARAADSARTSPLPLALTLRRRQRQSAGAKTREPRAPMTYSSHPRSTAERCACSRCPDCPGRARTCQERLRRRLRRSSTLDRTCPKVPESAAIGSRGRSGHGGQEWPKRTRQTVVPSGLPPSSGLPPPRRRLRSSILLSNWRSAFAL